MAQDTYTIKRIFRMLNSIYAHGRGRGIQVTLAVQGHTLDYEIIWPPAAAHDTSTAREYAEKLGQQIKSNDLGFLAPIEAALRKRQGAFDHQGPAGRSAALQRQTQRPGVGQIDIPSSIDVNWQGKLSVSP